MAARTYKPNFPGIYQIRNIVNGRVYVGSAINIDRRWREHRIMLKRNLHSSIRLQHSWNKHGTTAFIFELLEYVEDRAILVVREQFWMDRLSAAHRERGLNMRPSAKNQLGFKHSPETRARMALAHKGNKHLLGHVHSRETRDKISAAGIGRTGYKHSEDARARMSLWHQAKTLSEEHKSRIANAGRKRKMGMKTRLALRLANLGRKREHSAETRAKMAASHNRRHNTHFTT